MTTFVDPSTGEVVEVRMVPIDAVRPGPEVRRERISFSHVERMKVAVDDLPPITVREVDGSYELVDGHHRLAVHRELRREVVPAHVVDLSDGDSWMEAARSNIAHGLVLQSSERRAVATRILKRWPDYSDRAVAAACGLHHETVARLRPAPPQPATRPTGDHRQLDTPKRQGLDGKARPANPAQQRERIREQISAQPGASDREVARQTGASPSTVGAERSRLSLVPDEPESEEVAVGDIFVPVIEKWTEAPPCRRSDETMDFARFMDRRRIRTAEDVAALAASCPMELRDDADREAAYQIAQWTQLRTALGHPVRMEGAL